MTNQSNTEYGVSEHLVPYDIPKNFDGKLMFVAEAPGADEDQAKRPLVGKSGQKFNEWCEKTNVDRSNCIIANVFRYRPEANKIDKFFVTDRMAKEQKIEIVAAPLLKFNSKSLIKHFQSELEYLYLTIARNKPKVVVVMGNVALWATLNKTGITLAHGVPTVHNFHGKDKGKNYQHSSTVIPCFHPSACLPGRDVDGTKNAEVVKVFTTAKQKAEE